MAESITDGELDVLRFQISSRPEGTDTEAAVLHSLIARIEQADALLRGFKFYEYEGYWPEDARAYAAYCKERGWEGDRG